MAEYIEKQAAIDAINCDITITGRQNAELVAATIGTFADRIKAIPAADVVQVVRCKDCLFFTTEKSCCRPEGLIKAREDAFCSYGEKRGEE